MVIMECAALRQREEWPAHMRTVVCSLHSHTKCSCNSPLQHPATAATYVQRPLVFFPPYLLTVYIGCGHGSWRWQKTISGHHEGPGPQFYTGDGTRTCPIVACRTCSVGKDQQNSGCLQLPSQQTLRLHTLCEGFTRFLGLDVNVHSKRWYLSRKR